MGAPITSWHAARSCVCFFGASRRILCRALEMKTCIVRCSSASGGEPGTAGAAPDILLPRLTLAAALALSRAPTRVILVTSSQLSPFFSSSPSLFPFRCPSAFFFTGEISGHSTLRAPRFGHGCAPHLARRAHVARRRGEWEIAPHMPRRSQGARSARAAQAIKMLAKNALALRRVTPVGQRCMSALAGNVDKMVGKAAQMEKALPEILKPLAADMVRLSHSLSPVQRQPSRNISPQRPGTSVHTKVGPAVPASRGLVPQCVVIAGAFVRAARIRRRSQGQGCCQPGAVQDHRVQDR